MPEPGNIIQSSFSGSTGSIFNSTPIPINASALVYFIDELKPKKLLSVTYSLATNPFVAAGGWDFSMPCFGRLTVWRNFSQNAKGLFDPFFDASYSNSLPGVNNSNYYGPRIDYAKDETILDVLIGQIDGIPHQYTLDNFSLQDTDKLCIALSPFYFGFPISAPTPRIFGEYLGEQLTRTLSVNGCIGY